MSTQHKYMFKDDIFVQGYFLMDNEGYRHRFRVTLTHWAEVMQDLHDDTQKWLHIKDTDDGDYSHVLKADIKGIAYWEQNVHVWSR